MVLLLRLRRVLQRSAFRSGSCRSRGTARADGFLPDRRGLGAVPRRLGARPGKVAGRHEGGCRANRGFGVRPGAVDGALHRPPGVAAGEGTSRLDGDDRGRRALRVHERLRPRHHRARCLRPPRAPLPHPDPRLGLPLPQVRFHARHLQQPRHPLPRSRRRRGSRPIVAAWRRSAAAPVRTPISASAAGTSAARSDWPTPSAAAATCAAGGRS